MTVLPMDQYGVQGMLTLICIITPYSGVVGIIILVPGMLIFICLIASTVEIVDL